MAASPPRYPQVGKTVEVDEIAKRQWTAGRVVPRHPWEGKTTEGTTPQSTRRFQTPWGRYGAAVAGLSLGVGVGHQESRDRSLWCLRHPVDDTAPLGKPLHGRGHRRVTLSQVFKTQSRSQLSRCGDGKATDAFTKHRRRTYRVVQRSERNG